MNREIRVVIPCRNAEATIRQCLDRIVLSRGIDPQIVLVDDGGSDALSSLPASYPISLVRTLGGQGAGTARNCGTAGFDGAVLIFIDADVLVEADALARLVEPIVSGAADATVGRYSPSINGRNFAEAYKQLYLAYTYGKPHKKLKNTFWTALGAVSTGCFRQANGFETAYRGAGPEDIDLGVRLTAIGARIVPVPGAAAEHIAQRGLAGLVANDLRKGCEDSYIHWIKSISFVDNRHAGATSMTSVFLACLLPCLIGMPHLAGRSIYVGVAAALYAAFRGPLLIDGYRPAGLRIFIAAIPLTFLLDLVRGAAFCLGTGAAMIENMTKGKWKPFRKPVREIRT